MTVSPLAFSPLRFPSHTPPPPQEVNVKESDWCGFDRQIQKPANPGHACPLVCNATDRSISITRYADGSVEVSMKPPPISELVLSGGGAKGVAYSGFVDTLETSDVMDLIRMISGSSAGAISAALLASGMSHADFDRISDEISLISLLNSADPDVAALQDKWSRLGERLKSIPLAQLICDLVPRLGSKGMPLEDLIRKESCAALLQRCAEAKTPLSERAQQVIASIREKRFITFADLAVLSQEIPQIKTVEITGTAMFKEGAQLVVYSDKTTPDMDIAMAAHASAALPVVFSKPTTQGQPFQQRGETTAVADGGILNNTPISAVYNPTSQMSPIPDKEHLILVFEAEESDQGRQRGTGLSSLLDYFLGAPHTALSALNAEQIGSFAEQTVKVPLKTDQGDFRGALKGTLNFSMDQKTKDHLQEETRKAVKSHIDARSTTPQTFWFDSTEAALLALGDKEFDQLASELESDETCAQVIAFRRQAQEAWTQLKQAIQETNESSTRLEPNSQIHMAIWALDQLADQPGKLEWLAKRLNHNSDPDFMQFLQAAARWDKGASSAISAVTSHAVEEMNQRDLATRVDNVVRYVLYPSLYLGGQTSSNEKLIKGVIRDLGDVRSKKAFNNSLKRVIANYVSRSTGMPNPESHTRTTLRNMLFPEPLA